MSEISRFRRKRERLKDKIDRSIIFQIQEKQPLATQRTFGVIHESFHLKFCRLVLLYPVNDYDVLTDNKYNGSNDTETILELTVMFLMVSQSFMSSLFVR